MPDALSDDSAPDDAVEPKRPRVVVVGSANTDLTVRAPRLPEPGETLLGGAFTQAGGGKGANQAVAAARLGAVVTFLGCVGADSFGDAAVLALEAEGIDTRFVVRDPDAPTGVALITVDAATGENTIVVVPGANAKLSPALVARAAAAVRDADVVVCQLEVPLETVAAAFTLAREAGKITILNPAPARPLSDALLSLVSVLTPNEAESAGLLPPHPGGSVVVTLGAEGARLVTESHETLVPPLTPDEVVDTTAAGDCFTAALAVALGEGRSLEDAARFANAAASLSVEAEGAQPSLPNRLAVNRRLMGE